MWAKFQKACAAKGYTASDVLRAYIRAVVHGDITIDAVHPTKTQRGEMLVEEDAILNWFKKKK